MARKPTDVDLLMRQHLSELGHPFEKEYGFCAPRRWRFDWALFHFNISKRCGIEIEGGAWTQGRHTRGSGFVKDMDKYNKAACLGWSILRFTPDQIRNGEDIPVIKEWLESRR